MVQNVLAIAWEQFNLQMMLVSMDGSSYPRLLQDSAELYQVNPFKPLMTQNTAKPLPEILTRHPDMAIGILLRPCEMRALQGKMTRESFPQAELLTFCVDCLGTYPLEDYQWRAERKGSPELLAWESLHFARQGGIAVYRFRSACQACRNPLSQGADVNIGVIGLPVRQKILIDARNQDIADHLFQENSMSAEDQSLLHQRDYIVAKLLQRGSQTSQRLIENLESILPRNLDALIEHFVGCGECRLCLDNCPICGEEFPAKNKLGKYMYEDVKEWMVLCAGCGMCEQVCPNHLPLVTIFTHIRRQILDQTGFTTLPQ
jgi:formate dehydrogenase subunit beta